ncbi:MAG: Crp/Fnr family transcriptional regulator [Bacteroidota bacterium]
MHSTLLHTLNQIVKLDEEEISIICQRFKPLTISKGDFFLQEHAISKQVGFLQKGLVRYFVHKNDQEATFEFTKEGEFVSDYQSFNTQTPSLQNIQAIEDCELLIISYPDLQYIFKHAPHGDMLGRVILEHRFDVMVGQLMAIYMQNQETRYRHFIQQYSDLAQRIPQYMIASYVGIQPQSLSRIRRKAR